VAVAGRAAAAIAAGACGLLLLSAPASGQYLNAYKSGLEAIEARNWEQAARSMAEAIAERGDEKMKLPVRFFLRPYVPHFYLGYARFESGDCAGALAAWAESERQGVLQRLPEADVARRGREKCNQRTRQSAVAEARDQAHRGWAVASAAAAALLERSREDPASEIWAKGDPSPAKRHQQGQEILRQAGVLLDDDGVDPEGIRRAEALVHDAVRVFTALDADLDRLIEGRRQELATKGKGVDARVAEAQRALANSTYLAPYPRLLRKARADLEGLVAEARRRDSASQVHLDGLAARLENSIAELERLAAAPPEALEQAAGAFLGGRYQDVIAALETARFGEPRARAHARLLLAASRHALYLEGGELDHELRTAAVEDALACREDDERLAPTDRFFSPRFIAFFEESLALAPETERSASAE
jgi:hypothetical protein